MTFGHFSIRLLSCHPCSYIPDRLSIPYIAFDYSLNEKHVQLAIQSIRIEKLGSTTVFFHGLRTSTYCLIMCDYRKCATVYAYRCGYHSFLNRPSPSHIKEAQATYIRPMLTCYTPVGLNHGKFSVNVSNQWILRRLSIFS